MTHTASQHQSCTLQAIGKAGNQYPFQSGRDFCPALHACHGMPKAAIIYGKMHYDCRSGLCWLYGRRNFLLLLRPTAQDALQFSACLSPLAREAYASFSAPCNLPCGTLTTKTVIAWQPSLSRHKHGFVRRRPNGHINQIIEVPA